MAEQTYSVYNPEMGAPIDTIVDGVRYEIPGGETFADMQRAHAEHLQNTYPWLELSSGGKPVKTKKPEADGEDAGDEGEGDAAPAKPAKTAKKSAPKKAAKKAAKKK